MRYRTLGRTDIEVSTVAMGCWAIVGDETWGPQDEDDAIAAIKTAREVGITFFDTAEAYGDGYSEELLGRVLSDEREEVVIASKVSASHLREEDVKEACEASLDRLQTDYIDLYQIHWPNWDIPLQETCSALEELQEEGKIRAIGVSNFGPRDLTDVLDRCRVETDQVAYNLLWRGIEDQLQPLCLKNDVSVLPYCPLQQGLLTGKFEEADDVPEGRARTRHFSGERPQARHGQPGAEEETFKAIDEIRDVAEEIEEPMANVALSWLLSRLSVASVLAGARNPEQVRQNARAGDLALPETVLARLTHITLPLKEQFDGSLDMWQAESRLR